MNKINLKKIILLSQSLTDKYNPGHERKSNRLHAWVSKVQSPGTAYTRADQYSGSKEVNKETRLTKTK